MMECFVYILRSLSKVTKRYGGITRNVLKRLNEHNAGKSKFTSGFVPWHVIHVESFKSMKEARIREKYFKTGAGRRFIKRILLQSAE